MTLRWMYDASTPPSDPPHWHVAAGYIGGDTPRIWTLEEWKAAARVTKVEKNGTSDDS